MKKILFGIAICFLFNDVQAYQCRRKSDEQVYNEANVIFLAKILSNDNNGVGICH